MAEPQKGDKLTIRIGNEQPVLYVISDAKPGLVYIHKPEESHKLSALTHNGVKWTVYGFPANIDLIITPLGEWSLDNVGKFEIVSKLTNEQIFAQSLNDPFFNESVWKRLSKLNLPEFIKYKGRSELSKFAGEDSGPDWKTFYYLMSKVKTLKTVKNNMQAMAVLKSLAKYIVKEPFAVVFTDPEYKKYISEALKALVLENNLPVLKHMILTNNVQLAQYNSTLVDAIMESRDPDILALLLQNGLQLVQSDVDKLAQKNNIPLLDLLATYNVYPSMSALQYAYNADTDDLLVIMADKYGASSIFDPDMYDAALRRGKKQVQAFFEEFM